MNSDSVVVNSVPDHVFYHGGSVNSVWLSPFTNSDVVVSSVLNHVRMCLTMCHTVSPCEFTPFVNSQRSVVVSSVQDKDLHTHTILNFSGRYLRRWSRYLHFTLRY